MFGKYNKKNNHPKGLYILTFAEFWDRFTFCGTLTVLILYLTQILVFSDQAAYATWGTYTALGYITPVLGGIVADRILGFERPIIWGLILIIIGNLILGCLQQPISLAIGMAITLCGIGLFKGNISSLIGMLYLPKDIEREKGYSLFFMGIMLGAILGPTIYGLLTMYSGWQIGFLLSAFGNLCSLFLFLFQRKHFSYKNLPQPSSSTGNIFVAKISIQQSLFIALIATILITSLFFKFPIQSNNLLGFVSFSTVLGMMLLALNGSAEDRKKIIGLTLLNLFLVFYYAASMQVDGSLVVGIERNFHIHIFGYAIPSTVFASLEACFAFLLAPFVTQFWSYWARKYFEPSILFKIGVGHLLSGMSFIIFAWVFFNKTNVLSGLFIANFLLGISVICIFPTHLSAISQYSPLRCQGTLMSMSFLSSALAGYLGALINEEAGPSSNALFYAHTYIVIATLMLFIGIFIFLFSPYLMKLFNNTNKEILAINEN